MRNSKIALFFMLTLFLGIYAGNVYSVALPQAAGNSFAISSPNDANLLFQDQIQLQNFQQQLLTSPCQGTQLSECNPNAVVIKQSIEHTKNINN